MFHPPHHTQLLLRFLEDYVPLLLATRLPHIWLPKQTASLFLPFLSLNNLRQSHIFSRFFPRPDLWGPQASWGEPGSLPCFGALLGPGEPGSKGKRKTEALRQGRGLKTEKQFWIQQQDTACQLLCPVKHTFTKAETQRIPAGHW